MPPHFKGWFPQPSRRTACRSLFSWRVNNVRLYHWKQWSRSEAETASHQAARRAQRSEGNRPGTRRRNLIRLGIDPGEVYRASRSRKGYWRMSQN